jgi:hypothetical protein
MTAGLARIATPRLATVLAGAITLLLGLLIAAAAVAGKLTLDHLRMAAGILIIVMVSAAVGVVVSRHQPGNPIGWLLLGTSAWLIVLPAASVYAAYAYGHGHHGIPLVAPAAVVLAEQFPVVLIPFPLMILLFPDGRLPSQRWRWPLRAYLAVVTAVPLTVAAVTVIILGRGHARVLGDGYLAAVERPSGETAFLGLVAPVFIVAVVVFWLAAIASQALSWRRSSGDRRQQLKWLASGAAVCGVLGVSAVATTSALWEVLIVGFAALPIGIGIGIMKYRLYDIDRIISRTLSYAIVTGLLVGVYAGLVILATQVLGFHRQVAVAASTLAAAALFNPIRRRVQRAVDRRFNRARYNADRTIEAFAARLKDATVSDDVSADLVTMVSQALEPQHLWLWTGAP